METQEIIKQIYEKVNNLHPETCISEEECGYYTAISQVLEILESYFQPE